MKENTVKSAFAQILTAQTPLKIRGRRFRSSDVGAVNRRVNICAAPLQPFCRGGLKKFSASPPAIMFRVRANYDLNGKPLEVASLQTGDFKSEFSCSVCRNEESSPRVKLLTLQLQSNQTLDLQTFIRTRQDPAPGPPGVAQISSLGAQGSQSLTADGRCSSATKQPRDDPKLRAHFLSDFEIRSHMSPIQTACN